MLGYLFLMYLYGDFGDEYCDTGSVKHNKPTLSIVHDCSNAKNELVSELDSALPHIKNYRGHKDLPKRNLNPLMVLDLFKRMHREVDI
jgi:hypothetical protein